jgi:hypothetical protein
MLGVEARDLVAQRFHFLGPKQARKEQKPVSLKALELFLVELHGEISSLRPAVCETESADRSDL